MKRIAITLGAMLLLAGGTAFSASASETPPEHVIICHVAGLAEDPANYITLDLPWVAVYGEAGHFFENGTPRAGHEQDTLGECNPPPPPVDVCPNLEGNQSEVPPGFHLGEDENGRPACLEDDQPPPREVATIGVVCDQANNQYLVTGEVDGQAGTANPSTISGSKNGPSIVTVTLGEFSQNFLVETDGTCVMPPPPPPGTPPHCPITGAGLDGNIPPNGNTNDNCIPLPKPTPPAAKPVTAAVAAVIKPAAIAPAQAVKPAAPVAKPKPKPVRKPVAAKKKVAKKKVVHKKVVQKKVIKKAQKAPKTL